MLKHVCPELVYLNFPHHEVKGGDVNETKRRVKLHINKIANITNRHDDLVKKLEYLITTGSSKQI